jgi:hypothetical protein
MPRSRRRRVNDRRREAEQRLAARRVLAEARLLEKQKTERYVRAVLKTRAGEVVRSSDGRSYVVLDDGSFRRMFNATLEGGKGGTS